jgi:DNA helicase-2/ATP-dependent DNA helicase PcrA
MLQFVPKAKLKQPDAMVFEADARQREAIEHVHGPMLVIAGAGTGKTTVLTRRIARLIAEGHVRPDEILALTYTENAASEMRARVSAELNGENTSRLRVGTFHAYCNNLLIRTGRKFGVLDDQDLWIYLRKRIRELHLNYFVRAANVGKFLFDLNDFMRRCQDELVGPEKYHAYVERLARGELPIPRVTSSKDADSISDEEVIGRCQEIDRVFQTVESMLQVENLGTFGHMITRAYELLSTDSQLLAQEKDSTKFILVDEFQDANYAQVKILGLLAGEKNDVFAVGDPDQAIYQFRGASSAAFEIFRIHFPESKLVTLEKNRRSTTAILQCAFALIDKNPSALNAFNGNGQQRYCRRPLVSERDEKAGSAAINDPVETASLAAKEAESADIAHVIQQRKKQTACRWKDFAVLYRIHAHRDLVAEELAEQDIPFSIENMDITNSAEARDLFAITGAILAENDGASLFRVAALPQFAIDPVKLRAAMQSAPREAGSVNVALALHEIEGGASVFHALQQARDEISRSDLSASGVIEIAIEQFGLNTKSAVLAGIRKFVAAWEEKPVTKTHKLAEFMEYLELFREAGGGICLPPSPEDAVRLITVHSAKGLEFKHVFVLRANTGSFPRSYVEPLVEFPRELRNADSACHDGGKVRHNEEERRLFYVAMTRARDLLTIYAKQGTGRTDPTPPGYVRELLKQPKLKQFLHARPARAFQPELFASAAPSAMSRAAEWLSLPPIAPGTRLSASAIETYDTCPLQFKLDREWRIPRKIPAALHYGAALHRVLKAYFDSVRSGRELAVETLLESFRSMLVEARLEDEYQFDLYVSQGESQLREFVESVQRQGPPKVVRLEEPFEIRIGDAAVVGRVDRVDELPDGRVTVTDYKTGKSRSQEDADKSLQLSIYALAAKEKWGYSVARLMFYNLEENVAVETFRNEAQLAETKAKVESVAGCIAVGKFDAKAGFHCNFCAYRNLCPETEKNVLGIDKSSKN